MYPPFEELKCVAIEIVPDRPRCAVKVKIVRGISCLFIGIQGCPWAEGGDKGNLTPWSASCRGNRPEIFGKFIQKFLKIGVMGNSHSIKIGASRILLLENTP